MLHNDATSILSPPVVSQQVQSTANDSSSHLLFRTPLENASHINELMELIKKSGVVSIDGNLALADFSPLANTQQFRVNKGVVTPSSVKISGNTFQMKNTLLPNASQDRTYMKPVDGVTRVVDVQPVGVSTGQSNIIEITDAIWAAETITIPKDGIIVIPSHIKYFTLLADTIVFGENSIVTWSPMSDTSNPNPFVPKTPAAPPEKARCTVQNTRQSSSSCNGYPGQNGVKGQSGSDGENAPIVEVIANNIVGVPRFHLSGQDGQQGGVGGKGGPGGIGARGRNAKGNRFCLGCEYNKGWGGNGGVGGKGGSGGDGGDGGRGGKLIIYTSPNSSLSVDAFLLLTDGGSGGE
jgi:hypothetical protein